jgi:large subunit ribosomal protein L21
MATTEDRTMYAVIKTGGKQQKVQTGDVIQVELLDEDEDASAVTFRPLLVVDDAGTTHVGKRLGKAVVKAKLVGEKKGEKVKVVKYRPKTRYRRSNGHRQRYTVLEIEAIELGAAEPKSSAKSSAKPAAKAAAKPKSTKAARKADTQASEPAD